MPNTPEPAPGFLLGAALGFGRRVLGWPRRLRVLFCMVWMAGIWILSSQQEVLPAGADSDLWAFFSNLAHAPLFGLLAMWFGLAWLPGLGVGARPLLRFPGLRRAQVLAIFGLVIAYGWLDEWHQSWVPTRDSTLADVCIDAIGAANVLWVAGYLASDGACQAGLLRRLGFGVLLCSLGTYLLTFQP